MADQHADYLGVSEEHRWGQPLNGLMGALQKRAWALKGKAAWVVLPHGALVSLRVIPPEEGTKVAFHYELRIARKEAPTDQLGWKRWATELAVFLKHLAGGDDVWEEVSRSTEKAEATYRFLIAKPAPKPMMCKYHPDRIAIEPGLYKEDLCRECAIEKANQEVAENRRQHDEGHDAQLRLAHGDPALPADGGE
jgi:hypothetical protein